MTTNTPPPSYTTIRRSTFSIWRVIVPLLGITVSIVTTYIMFTLLFDMGRASIISMIQPMGQFALVVNGIGVVLYWLCLYYSRSIRWTTFFTILFTAVLTVINGYRAANIMFDDLIILKDVGIILVFSTIISLAFNIMGLTSLIDNVRQLRKSVDAIASGNFKVRADVQGRDEIAQLGTQFNQMAESLETAEREREEVAQLRRDLTAWVSHDLRTPLTSIRVIVEALNDGIITEEEDVKRYYKTILTDVLGLNQMINELFEMAQLDAGKTNFPMSTVRLFDQINLCIDMVQPIGQKRNIALKTKLDFSAEFVHGNAEKIGRVLNNLTNNAIKYTPDNGEIMIRLQRVGDMAQISVEDSGSGFSEADLPRIFEQFYRGEPSRSRDSNKGSAGLGLAISQSIVEAHDGKIWADNLEQGGARVTFTIPLQQTG